MTVAFIRNVQTSCSSISLFLMHSLVVSYIATLCTCGFSQEETGAWKMLPPPPGESEWSHVAGVAAEKGVHLYVLTNNIWMWNGKEWSQVKKGTETLRVGTIYDKIAGGIDRPIFMTNNGGIGSIHSSGKEKPFLYKVVDGGAIPVVELPQKEGRSGTNYFLYVSKSQIPIVWGYSGLCAFNGQWVFPVEAERLQYPKILDFSPEGPVVFWEGSKVFSWTGSEFIDHLELGAIGKSQTGDAVSPFCVCKWGGNKALVIQSRPEVCKSVEFGEAPKVVDLPQLAQVLQKHYIVETWGAPDGNVWLFSDTYPDKTILVLSPEGSVSELKRIEDFTWLNLHFNMSGYVGSSAMLQDSTGSLWISIDNNPLRRIRLGQIEKHDWQRGLCTKGFDRLIEMERGKIIATSTWKGVFYWDENAQPFVPDPSWSEYVIESPPTVAPDGSIWVFRKDKPKSVSLWDGVVWKHVELPFDVSKIAERFADDKGHLIMQLATDNKWSVGVSVEGITYYKTIWDALQNAVVNGSRRFLTNRSGVQLVVTENGEIWLSYGWPQNEFRHFNGAVWETINVQELNQDEGITGILYSKGNQPIFYSPSAYWQLTTAGWQKLAGRDSFSPKVLMAGTTVLPYWDGLNKDLLEGYVPLLRISDYNFGSVASTWDKLTLPTVDGHKVKATVDFSPNEKPTFLEPMDNRILLCNGFFWVDGTAFPLGDEYMPIRRSTIMAGGNTPNGNFWMSCNGNHMSTILYTKDKKPPQIDLTCLTTDKNLVMYRIPDNSIIIAVFARAQKSSSWKRIDTLGGTGIPIVEGQRVSIELRAVDCYGCFSTVTIVDLPK